jgi:hypothetical protein
MRSISLNPINVFSGLLPMKYKSKFLPIIFVFSYGYNQFIAVKFAAPPLTLVFADYPVGFNRWHGVIVDAVFTPVNKGHHNKVQAQF